MRADRGRAWALLVVGLVLLILTGGACSLLSRGVSAQAGAGERAIALGRAGWIAAPGGASTSWFRTRVDLTSPVVTGTLLLDADQAYTFWVNGHRGPTNRDEVRRGVSPGLHALDVGPSLRTGANAVTVQVTNTRGGAASLVARVVVQTRDGGTTTVDSTPTSWRSTSDASLLGAAPGTAAAATEFTDPAASWVEPRAVAAVRVARSELPAAAVELPLRDGLAVDPGEGDVALSATVSATNRPGSWMRLATMGAWQLTVDGQVVMDRPPVARVLRGRPRPTPLYVVDLGPVLPPGTRDLVVHVTGAPAYLDGELAVTGGSTPLVAPRTWRTSGTAVTSALPSADDWPRGLTQQWVLDPDDAPRGSFLERPVVGAAALLLVWGLAVGAGRIVLPGAGLRSGAILALGAAPAAGALALVWVLAHWASFDGGFPFVAATRVTVLALLVAGLLAAGSAAAADVWSRSDPATPVRVNHRDKPSMWGVISSLGSRMASLHASRLGIVVVAVSSAALAGVGIRREPIWQDEAVSLLVADSIRARGVPRLPSGLLYMKGELYHYPLALLRAVTESITIARGVSLVWFAGTVVAFGLLLMPVLAPRRPGLHFVATVVFACAPAEIVWAHDVRMYQQMQFFAVCFLAVVLRALSTNGRRPVVASAVLMAAMYLSHEESFVLLPVVPVMLLLAWRSQWWRRPVWWWSYGTAGGLIALQYVLAQVHPPTFGSDLSNRSYIGWDTDQAWFYYNNVYFRAFGAQGTLGLISVLALVGLAFGLCRRDQTRILAGSALLAGAASVSLVFTVKIDRYTFVLLPLLFALASAGGADLVALLRRQWDGRTWGAERPSGLAARRLVLVPSGLVAVPAALTALALVLSMAGAPRAYGDAAADLTGGVSGATLIDYAPVTDYVRRHWRSGDTYITLCPPDLPAYYLGRVPDRIVQTGRNKLLYIIENHGRATDTVFGSRLLLNGQDVQDYLGQQGRVWLVTDTGSYASGTPRDVRTALSDFRLQDQEGGAAVYLWQGA